MNDDPDAAECPVTKLVGRNTEMPVVHVDQSVKYVDKESVTSSDFFRFTSREEVSISFRVSSYAPNWLILERKTLLGILRLILVLCCIDFVWGWFGQFIDVLAQYPFPDPSFGSLTWL